MGLRKSNPDTSWCFPHMHILILSPLPIFLFLAVRSRQMLPNLEVGEA